MADRPILFSAPMIQALRAGSKTQTRRKLKPQPAELVEGQTPKALRIAAGDRLWVRESYAVTKYSLDYETGMEESYFEWDDEYGDPRSYLDGDPRVGCCAALCYRADGEDNNPSELYPCIGLKGEVLRPAEIRWRPSIFMPRWASRLTLLVDGVKGERLQDISEADVIAEGAPLDPNYRDTTQDGSNPHMVALTRWSWISPLAWYHRLWDQINGAGAWDENPFVAAYAFRVLRGNIDKLEGTL